MLSSFAILSPSFPTSPESKTIGITTKNFTLYACRIIMLTQMGALNPQTQLKIHHIGTSRLCENRDLATENVMQKREGEER
jgi:hypothetical protein